ncbi:hypothetical protein ACHAWO_007778 [Cyclotella atomus]|uniref:Coenzyme Q-binding protein COQ10 START domain-containing protein n=1 Tax=Cyclotella atomus TaxID=382360 RepID=A0ABD3PAS3_9STRA
MTATKKSKIHQHFSHDKGLLRTLTLSWLAVLVVGLALKKGLELFPNHINSLLPSFSFSRLISSNESDPSWQHVEFHGDVELFRRPMALVLEEYAPFFSTKATGLYAYRAVTAVDLPIEALLHVFRDTPNNGVWMKDLKEAEVSHKSGAHHTDANIQVQTAAVRHRYNVPIPGVSDREFYMHQKVTSIENSKGKHVKVTFEFEPFNEKDDKMEMFASTCFGCVRATKLAKWTFTSLNDSSTKIELEVAADPNMPFTNFFVNIYQKMWPHANIHGLVTAARHHLHRNDEIQVTNVLFKLFPLKM